MLHATAEGGSLRMFRQASNHVGLEVECRQPVVIPQSTAPLQVHLTTACIARPLGKNRLLHIALSGSARAMAKPQALRAVHVLLGAMAALAQVQRIYPDVFTDYGSATVTFAPPTSATTIR